MRDYLLVYCIIFCRFIHNYCSKVKMACTLLNPKYVRYLLTFFLIVMVLPLHAQSHNDSYDRIFSENRNIKDTPKTRELLANYLSSDDNEIVVKYIDTVFKSTDIYLKNYGFVDLITVVLSSSAPKVLYTKFLLIVSHASRHLSYLNLDDYYIVKSKRLDTRMQIVAVRNFKGHLELCIYDYINNTIYLKITNSIYDSTDCDLYKYGTLNIKNIDLNNDERLDLEISYKVSHFCDKDGAESEKSLYETEHYKRVFF